MVKVMVVTSVDLSNKMLLLCFPSKYLFDLTVVKKYLYDAQFINKCRVE